MMRRFILIILIITLTLLTLPVFAEDESNDLHLAKNLSYNIQKFTGFSFITECLSEKIIKSYLFFKTKTIRSKVDIDSYSGTDLLTKKAKSIHVFLKHPKISDIQLESFDLNINGPIYIKKIKNQKGKKKYKLLKPLDIKTKTIINIEKNNQIVKDLPSLNIPIPPFGKINVKITKLNISINEDGLIKVRTIARSIKHFKSEPLDIRFSGRLYVKNKKILIKDVDSEILDIFTKNSELGRAFDMFLEDLINPVINFEKYERKGLTINKVDLLHENSNLILLIDAKKSQHKIN